jgi:hypothetical protein
MYVDLFLSVKLDTCIVFCVYLHKYPFLLITYISKTDLYSDVIKLSKIALIRVVLIMRMLCLIFPRVWV